MMVSWIGGLCIVVPIFALGYWYGYWVYARQAKKRLPPVVREAEAFLRTL